MIDTNDKTTQALDLGAEPKRRGRPAKQNALSNAERQRLYRERQKAQRNEKPIPAAAAEAALITAIERADDLAAKLGRANERIKELEGFLEERCKQLASLTKRNNRLSAEVKRRYILQYQDPDKGTWHDDSTGDYGSKAKAVAACKKMNEPGFSYCKWRVREREWV